MELLCPQGFVGDHCECVEREKCPLAAGDEGVCNKNLGHAESDWCTCKGCNCRKGVLGQRCECPSGEVCFILSSIDFSNDIYIVEMTIKSLFEHRIGKIVAEPVTRPKSAITLENVSVGNAPAILVLAIMEYSVNFEFCLKLLLLVSLRAISSFVEIKFL